MPYVPGDWYVICDRTGFKRLASKCRRTWDGLYVRNESWEARHPQDFVRAKKDDQTVPIARPRQTDIFVNPGDVTAEDL